MPIPDIQSLMGPLLELAADGNIHVLSEAREQLAQKFKLTEEERSILPASGKGNPLFTNNVAWAAVNLGKLGYVTVPQAGQIMITEAGHQALGTLPPPTVVENTTEFELEKYLEEFMVSNFARIFQGKLVLYKNPQDPDVTGQQYVTNVGIIDILARETATNSFVVIELKRGRAADTTVGQVLRYMGWVSENLCEKDQAVKGMIVCKEPDPKLSYALKMIANVQVRYYHIDFTLSEKA